MFGIYRKYVGDKFISIEFVRDFDWEWEVKFDKMKVLDKLIWFEFVIYKENLIWKFLKYLDNYCELIVEYWF